MCGLDGRSVGNHDIEFLLSHRVSIRLRVGTIERVFTNMPSWHILKLEFDETTNFILANIGVEATGEVIEDIVGAS